MTKLFPFLLLLGLAWAQEVRVAAASDLLYALEEVRAAFLRAHPGVKVTPIFGSSGKLYTQILQGLPVDLFLSADERYPRFLEERGLAEPGTRIPYALGRLALWVRKDLGLDPAQGTALLRSPKARGLALANPVHAPYGRAAATLLERYGLLRRRVGPNLPWEALPWERGLEALYDPTPLKEGKESFTFLYGENASQAAQLALKGPGVGLIPLSLVQSPALEGAGGHWVAPMEAHLPLLQVSLVLKGRGRPEVLAFQRFLVGPEGRAILQRYGFGLP